MPYYSRRNYRTRRAYRPIASKTKYSQETNAFSIASSAFDEHNSLQQTAYAIVPDTSIQGMRKVKHIQLSLTVGANTDNISPLYWAIVYVPEGFNLTSGGATSPNWLQTGGSMYEPNQYIMNCGIVDPSAGPIRFNSPLARNLNSGDKIYLVVGASSAYSLSGVVKYAITMM